MKKIKKARLLKKLGMLASAIAPVAVVASGDGSGGVSEHATEQQVRNLSATDVSTKPSKARDVEYDTEPLEVDITSPQHNGFTFDFVSATNVDANGNSVVRFTLGSSDSSVRFTKQLDFTVSGFQTKAVYDANAEIRGLSSSDLDTPPAKVSGRTINFGATPTADDVTDPSKSGFSFTFASATSVTSGGTSDVTYDVTKDSVVGSAGQVTFTVSNFQTEAVFNANAEIGRLTSSDLDREPAKASGRTVNFGGTPTTDDVTDPSKSGFSFTFASATSVTSGGTSDVTYDVTKDSVVGSAGQVTFTVSNFQTEAVFNANAEIGRLTSSDLDREPAKASGRTVNFGGTPTTDDVTDPSKSGFSFTFASATSVISGGTSDVTYDVTKDSVVGSAGQVTFTVSNFQTEAVFNANAEIGRLTSSDLDREPAKASGRTVNFGGTPTADDVTDPSKSDFSFTFASATSVTSGGTSDVTYDVTKDSVVGSAGQVTFTVSNFQTEAVFNANAEIGRLTSSDLDREPAKASGRTVNFGGTPTTDDVIDPSKSGFSFTFASATSVTSGGTSDVTYDVTKDSVAGSAGQVTFTVSNFQTESVFNANAEIRGLSTSDLDREPAKVSGRTVNFGGTPTTDDVTDPSKSGFSFTFASATSVTSGGTSDVTYDVTKDSVVGSAGQVTFTVSNFQTEAVFNANAEIGRLTSSDLDREPAKASGRTVNFGGTPTTDDVIDPSKSGFSFTFASATSVTSGGTSDVTYDVTKDSVVGSAGQVTFTVSNFQTEAVFNANAEIGRLTSSDLDREPAKASGRTVNFGDTPTADDVTDPSKSDFSFTFASATSVTSGGTSDVTYDVTKDSVVGSAGQVTFTVSNFQTEAVFNANAEIGRLTSSDLDREPAKASGRTVNFGGTPTTDDVIDPSKSGFSFTFASATSVTSGGTSDVTYDVTKDSVVGSAGQVTFTVSNFQTEAVFNANAEIGRLTSSDLDREPAKASGRTVNFGGTPTTDDVTDPSKSDFSFTFASATSVTSGGTSDVTYDVTKDSVVGSAGQVTFTVSNFQTEAVFNANAEIGRLTSSDLDREPAKVSGRTVNFGGTPTTDDVIDPSKSGFSFTFASATSVTSGGTSDVTYDVTKDSVAGSAGQVTFTVSNFQTESVFNANAEIRGLSTSDLDREPAKVSGRTVNFGGTPTTDDVTDPSKSGFSFTFASATSVTSGGTSDVTYDVTKDSVAGSAGQVTFTVSNFQTESVFNANAEIRGLSTSDLDREPAKVSGRTVNFGGTPTTDDVTDPSKSGFSFTFASATSVTSGGTSDVTYDVTKDSVAGSAEQVTFTVSSFQTKAVFDANAEIRGLSTSDLDREPAKVSGRTVNFGGTPTTDDVTDPSKSGFSFTFASATSVTSGGTSDVTYDVTKDSVAGSAEQVTFTVSSFQTKAVFDANAEIRGLSTSDLDREPAKVSGRTVNFGGTPTTDDVTDPSKSGFSFTFASATSVTSGGTSDVTYDVTKDSVADSAGQVTFTVSSFQTEAEAADALVNGLSPANMDTQPKKTPSRPLVNIGTSPMAEDFTLPAKSGVEFQFISATAVSVAGESVVTFRASSSVSGSSATKDLNFAISGFGSKILVEANKYKDFKSTQNIESIAENLKTTNDDTSLNDIKGVLSTISGYTIPSLDAGFVLSKMIVKTAYNEDTRQVVYTLKITKDGTENSVDHDITITFAPDWNTELEKIEDFVTTDDVTTPMAMALVDASINVKDSFMRIVNYENPDFAPDVEIKKVVVKTALDSNSRKVVYTVTLWDGANEHSTTKDVTVTFAPNWTAELAKLQDFETTDTVETAAAILKTNANINFKDEFEGIDKSSSSYTKPAFSEGVAISKVVVKTELNENTRQVVYTITLKNGDEDHGTTKDVTVTFTHTLEAEANKIKDFVTSDDLSKAGEFEKGDEDKKIEFKAITNYEEPTFVTGISIIKVVVETAYDESISANENTRQVVFEVTLEEEKSGAENPIVKKLVTVTFKPDFTLEKDKLTKNDDDTDKKFSSKKGTYSELAKKVINDDVTKLFIDNGGLILPKFAPGVSIKSVVVKALPDVNREATYEVILTDTRTDEGPFDVVVQFAENLDAGLNDLNDFTTTDDTKSDAALLPESMDDDKKNEFTGITGFITPTFAEGVGIFKVAVKTALNLATRQVVYEVTLQEDNKDNNTPNPTKKKDITVTFAPDLDLEGNKFSDFSTTDNDKSDAAILDASDEDVQGTFKAITGYSAPNLVEGVTIKSINVKNAINDSRQVVFTIRLGFGEAEVEKDVTVTFAASPSQQTKDTALTTTQIIGIAIGSALGLGVLGYLIYYLIKRRR